MTTIFRCRYSEGIFDRVIDVNTGEDGVHVIVQSPLPSYPHLTPKPKFSEIVHLRNGEVPALVINKGALQDLGIELILE